MSTMISVIMPVRNMELFVLSAVDSILKQSFPDFEFIIINDASNDNTQQILDEVKDSRIVRVNNNIQTGNYKCRNQGISLAKGEYICVMDADDIAHPERLQKQLDFMESNTQYLAAGSDIEFFSGNNTPHLFQRERDYEQIKVDLLRDNVSTHPTLIIRRNVFDRYNIRYDESYYYSADYDLTLQISRIGAITNIPEALVLYRLHNGQISSSNSRLQEIYADQIRLRQLSFLKLRPSVDNVMLHLFLMNDHPIAKSKLSLTENWCNQLLEKNNRLKVYEEKRLYSFLEKQLKSAVHNSF